jgi:hypothetical protein
MIIKNIVAFVILTLFLISIIGFANAIPKFGFFTGVLTLLGAISVFFLVRKK